MRTPWPRLARRCLTVLADLCTVAVQKELNVDAHDLINTPWSMAETRTQMPDVLEDRCTVFRPWS